MLTPTSDLASELHRPEDSAAGRTVFAFDRDQTIDVNPPREEGLEAVPIEWVGYLAHETDHIVYATGNQALKGEAKIPGIAEIVDAYPQDPPEDDSVRARPRRETRVRMLGELYPEADQLIVVDDADLSSMEEWTHFFSWDFAPAARAGDIVSDLPPSVVDIDAVEGIIEPRYREDYF